MTIPVNNLKAVSIQKELLKIVEQINKLQEKYEEKEDLYGRIIAGLPPEMLRLDSDLMLIPTWNYEVLELRLQTGRY